MNIRVTGDERDVANSAWVSTLDEIRATKKTDEQVIKLVQFLVRESHTSPLESVTITLEYGDTIPVDILHYAQSPHAHVSGTKLTIDLLNFLKVTHYSNLWNGEPWKLFVGERETLSDLSSKFADLPDTTSPDVTVTLGDNHGMEVELVHLHDEGDSYHSRATWRIKCPLSISVQILRHRKGSFNQSSGRYRTLKQGFCGLADDVADIGEKAGVDLSASHEYMVEHVFPMYEANMKMLKQARDDGKITNDEYKRARECARFILPEGRLTDMYVTMYLSDFYSNYKMLRNSVHAQTEHVWVAQEMERTLDAARNS